MRRAIYKGVVVGVLILGIAYFWHEQGELYMDVLRHIPQILFEDTNLRRLTQRFKRNLEYGS